MSMTCTPNWSEPAHPGPDLARPPFDQLRAHAELLRLDWQQQFEALDTLLRAHCNLRLIEQTPALATESLHYEARIHERGELAMRRESWHDIYGALMWLAFPHTKAAINRGQVRGLQAVGARSRTRHQQALTHLDEAGMVFAFSDVTLLERLMQHDWPGLLIDQRDALGRRYEVLLLGHALFELSHLRPHELIAGKVLPVEVDADYWKLDLIARRQHLDARLAPALDSQRLGADPKDLPNLPLAAVPGWHPSNHDPQFIAQARCFRPRPEGRVYAQALGV